MNIDIVASQVSIQGVPQSLDTSPAQTSELAHTAKSALASAPMPAEAAISQASVEAPRAQDLPPQPTLEKRNAETDLMGSYRQLENALTQGTSQDTAKISTALEHLTENLEAVGGALPEAVSDNISALVERAKIQTGNPTTDISDTTTVANTGNAVLHDTGVSINEAGEQSLDVQLSAPLMKELETLDIQGQDVGKGMDMPALQARRDELETLLASLPDDSAASEPVKAAVEEKILQFDRAIASREQCQTCLEALAKNDTLPLLDRSSELGGPLRTIWENAQGLSKAANQMQSADSAVAAKASTAIEQGGFISPSDFETLNAAMIKNAGETTKACLQELAKLPDKPAALDSTLKALGEQQWNQLGELCLKSGIEPQLLADTLADCLRGLPFNANAPVEANSVLIALDGMTSDVTTERLAFTDMLFQGAQAERGDESLKIKLALTPPDIHEGVKCQHEMQESLRVIQHHILDTVNTSGGRTGTLNRAMGNASARSFLLTPELVAQLKASKTVVNVEALNYHIAHVALLQSTASSYGLLGAEVPTLDNFEAWSNTLNLDAQTKAYANELAQNLTNPSASPQGDPMDKLLEANNRFNKGLTGTTQLEKASELVRNVGGMATHRSSAKYIHAMYQTDPHFLASELLDKHIVNLTGLIKAEDRLLANDSLSLDKTKVNNAMEKQVGSLLAKQLDGASASQIQHDLQDAMAERASTLKGLRGKRAKFIANTEKMQNVATASNQRITLRSKVETAKTQLEDNKSITSGVLKFTWPHQSAARTAVCRDVRELALTHAAINEAAATPNPVSAKALAELETKRDTLMTKLADVDMHTMRHTGKPAAYADADEMLRVMQPRANAVLYFAEGTAKADRHEIRHAARHLHKLQHTINSMAGKASSVFGKDVARRMEGTIAAAALSTFLENGADLETFSVHTPENQAAIKAQIQQWGLDPDKGIMAALLPKTLESITTAKGTMDMSSMRLAAKKLDLRLAGKEALKERAAELHPTSLNRIAAKRAAKKEIKFDPNLSAAKRQEGLQALMNHVEDPGSSFAYVRGRGVVLDTGRSFSPTDSQRTTKINNSAPIAVRLSAMHDNSMAVFNAGANNYQVMLKGHWAVEFAASAGISLPQGFNLDVEAGVGVGKDKGIVLNFNGKDACGKFVEAFLNPKSGMTNAQTNHDIWLNAEQIRFVNGKSVSGNVGASVSHSLFQATLGKNTLVSLTGSASLSFAGQLRTSIEQNAHGETAIYERTGSIQAGLGVAAGKVKLDDPSEVTVINALSKGVGTAHTITQRFKVATDHKGLSSATCMEMECPLGDKADISTLKHLLPDTMRDHIRTSPVLANEIEQALLQAPPDARVTVHWEIKPDVLRELRSAYIEARASSANGIPPEDALDKIHARLAEKDSYRPSRLTISSTTQNLPPSHSPGMGPLQYQRVNAMPTTQSTSIDLPKL